MKKISPFAPIKQPILPEIKGIRLAAVNCGIRNKKRLDLMLAVFDSPANVAGIFTKSSMPGEPVVWCKKILPNGLARALIVNSGISNVFTGEQGSKTVSITASEVANIAGCNQEQVYISSTGVIGMQLNHELITKALPPLYKKLSPDAWIDAASAIMTTDTFPKVATRKAIIDKKEVTINGFAKGSGMIAPDMATMLGYIFTDAAISAKKLQELLSEAAKYSFNAITVDSDTSTSDTVLLFATGHIKTTEDDLADFKEKLQDLMLELAQMIAKDGEGASKFITVKVTGAEDERAARVIAMSIANSPLIKTAIAGEDPNWGRIVMAVGKTAERASRDDLKIYIGDELVAVNGVANPDYVEEKTAQYMKSRYINLSIDVGIGKGEFIAYTCDFTDNYIKINADYRS